MATPSIPVPKIDFTKVRVINNVVDIHVTPMPLLTAAPAIAAPKIDLNKPSTALTKDQISHLQDLVMSAVPCTPTVRVDTVVPLALSVPAPVVAAPVLSIDLSKVHLINNAVDSHVTPLPLAAATTQKIDLNQLLHTSTSTSAEIAHVQELVMSAVPCTPMVDTHKTVSLTPAATAIAAPSISAPTVTAPTIDVSKLHVIDATVDAHVTPVPAAAATTQKIDLSQLLHTSTSTSAEIAHAHDLVMSAVPCTPIVMDHHTFMMC